MRLKIDNSTLATFIASSLLGFLMGMLPSIFAVLGLLALWALGAYARLYPGALND